MAEKDATKKGTQSSTMMNFDDVQVTRAHKFKPDPALDNLCQGYIQNVELRMQENPKYKEDGSESLYEYAGVETPVMIITFEQKKTKEDPHERIITLVGKPVVSKDNDGNEIAVKTIGNLYTEEYRRMRHVTDQFKGMPTYNHNLGGCPGIDYKASPAERAKQFTAFFQYFKDLLDGTGDEPVWKGKLCWIKVIADPRKGSFYTLPNFVGTGFIELVKEGIKPAISIQPGESVVLKESKKSAAETAVAGGGSPEMAAGTAADLDALAKKYS